MPKPSQPQQPKQDATKCVACQGKGTDSRGFKCWICSGTGDPAKAKIR